MGRSRALALATAILAAAALSLQAQDSGANVGIVIPSARAAALGGTHAALADDITALFANPAGFRSAGPELAISEVTIGLAGPVFSIADLIVQAVSYGTPPLELIQRREVQKLLNGMHTAATLNGPLSFGYVGDGLGFGIFNSTGLQLETLGALPMVTAALREDLVFAAGYSFGIPLPEVLASTLDLGFLLKASLRGTIRLKESIIEMISLFEAPSVDILYGQPFQMDVRIGLDAGILYSFNKLISLGVVGRNLYAPSIQNSYSTLQSFFDGAAPVMADFLAPIDLSVGLLFSPNLGPLEPYVGGLKIALDYADILDFLTHPSTATNPVLHASLGAEIVLLDILSLRGGFGQGYFSAGLGLDLSIFRLSLSMFGSELSSEPGLRPVYNLILGLEFRY